jgi:MFS superfamily sulfate permease-like transporter
MVATATHEARQRPALAQYFAILGWLRMYDRAWRRPDLIAALTVWALVVPQTIAYAGIAGLPPQAGLFATFAGLIGYALCGTSRQMVVSPTSSTAAMPKAPRRWQSGARVWQNRAMTGAALRRGW